MVPVITHGMGNVLIVWLNVQRAPQVLIAQLAFQDIIYMHQEQVHYIAYKHQHAQQVASHVQVLHLAQHVNMDII